MDVRVIASTNKNPEQLVPVGKFREDLYFRLSVLHVLFRCFAIISRTCLACALRSSSG